MKATPEEGISTQENQLMGISSSSIVGIFSTNTPVMYQSISILRLPLSFLPTLVRITYEGNEGGREKFEGETGEQRWDEEERQEPMLKKWKFYNYFLSSRTFSNFLLLKKGVKNPKIMFDQFSPHYRQFSTTLIFSFSTKKFCTPPKTFFWKGLKSPKLVFNQFSRHFRQF